MYTIFTCKLEKNKLYFIRLFMSYPQSYPHFNFVKLDKGCYTTEQTALERKGREEAEMRGSSKHTVP